MERNSIRKRESAMERSSIRKRGSAEPSPGRLLTEFSPLPDPVFQMFSSATARFGGNRYAHAGQAEAHTCGAL